MKNVITISRQYGSGGREVGSKLAAMMDIPFYDNEIISRAAKESGFTESAFDKLEDKATNSLLYSIAMGMNVFANQDIGYTALSLDDRVFLAQSNIIRKFADEGPCVIVGRCADYILKDLDNVINIFVKADLDFRIKRSIEIDNLDKSHAATLVSKKDKSRANYYRYHTGDKYYDLNNYDLVVRSDLTGIDGAANVIKAFLEEM